MSNIGITTKKPWKRRTPSIRPVNSFRIYCEGKTEEIYINRYIANKNSQRIFTKIIRSINNKTTFKSFLDLVESGYISKNHKVYFVLDRENNREENNSDEDIIKQLDRAVSLNVKVIYTNVCFEQFLLWHMIDSKSPHQTQYELIKSREFKEAFNNYSKSNEYLIGLFNDLFNDNTIQEARVRAKLYRRNSVDNLLYSNPSSNFYELLDDLDQKINEFYSSQLNSA